MDKQVNVTLTALSGDVSFAERRIILNPNNLTMQIGRASKSLSKGILGAPNNAWFDSPVMSRDHAELCLNPSTNIITVHDTGSMHGTYLQGAKLPRNKPTTILDGDEVVFGAEVRRGHETFPACAFRVNLEFVPYKQTNTFTFPDSSDIEDEDEYDLSDDDMDGPHQQVSSDDDISIEVRPAIKVSQAITSIDLTREDSPIIDLTGDSPAGTPAESHLLEVMEGRPVDLDRAADPVSIAVYAGNFPKLVESEDEEEFEIFSSDSDDQSDNVDSDDSDSMDEEMDESLDYGSSDSIDGDQPVDYGCSDSEGENEGSELGLESSDPLVRFAIATESDQGVVLSDLRTRIRAPEGPIYDDDYESNENESVFGLSEAGEEGIRALFESSPLRSSDDEPETTRVDKAQTNIKSQPPTTAQLEESSKHIKFTSELSSPLPSMSPGIFAEPKPLESPSFEQFLAPDKVFPQSGLTARQPSPSDAAMVKTTPPKPTTNEVPVSYLQSQEFGQLTQSLGDRSGKHAFFNAREENKAKMNASLDQREHDTHPLRSALNSTFAVKFPTETVEQPAAKRLVTLRIGGQSTLLNSSLSNTANDTKSEESSNFASKAAISAANRTIKHFLGEPARPLLTLDDLAPSPIVNKAPVPDYDMTSAVKYNESKAKSVRSRLSINDIIEGSAQDKNPEVVAPKVGNKRKVSEISDVIENEVRAWGSALDKSQPTDGATATTTPGHPEVGVAPSAPEQRPTKRLRTILERAAFAAVGGVAVGAGLFFSLVATAPDFA